jgi:hypothetical protein
MFRSSSRVQNISRLGRTRNTQFDLSSHCWRRKSLCTSCTLDQGRARAEPAQLSRIGFWNIIFQVELKSRDLEQALMSLRVASVAMAFLLPVAGRHDPLDGNLLFDAMFLAGMAQLVPPLDCKLQYLHIQLGAP